jgi:3-methylcrotonyl-CoA carboxylase alpha subunit
VEWQLRVASGEKLPKAQHELTIQGHAMEARLYAENPDSGFLPSTGPLTHFRMPRGIRVDTGVEQGGAGTPFYDPMIAKLIVHAPSRRAAAAKLAGACAEVEVWPVKTNAAFLVRAAAHPEFVAGNIDTSFIEQHLGQLVPGGETPAEVWLAAARARLGSYAEPATAWGAANGFRLNAQPKLQVEVQIGTERQWIVVDDTGRPALRSATVGSDTIIFQRGHAFASSQPQSLASSAGAAADGAIRAPMPGKLIAVQVADGAVVVKGQALVTLEAMKMEHTLTAPFDGRAADLAHKTGDQVSEGTVLLRIAREA